MGRLMTWLAVVALMATAASGMNKVLGRFRCDGNPVGPFPFPYTRGDALRELCASGDFTLDVKTGGPSGSSTSVYLSTGYPPPVVQDSGSVEHEGYVPLLEDAQPTAEGRINLSEIRTSAPADPICGATHVVAIYYEDVDGDKTIKEFTFVPLDVPCPELQNEIDLELVVQTDGINYDKVHDYRQEGFLPEMGVTGMTVRVANSQGANSALASRTRMSSPFVVAFVVAQPAENELFESREARQQIIDDYLTDPAEVERLMYASTLVRNGTLLRSEDFSLGGTVLAPIDAQGLALRSDELVLPAFDFTQAEERCNSSVLVVAVDPLNLLKDPDMSNNFAVIPFKRDCSAAFNDPEAVERSMCKIDVEYRNRGQHVFMRQAETFSKDGRVFRYDVNMGGIVETTAEDAAVSGAAVAGIVGLMQVQDNIRVCNAIVGIEARMEEDARADRDTITAKKADLVKAAAADYASSGAPNSPAGAADNKDKLSRVLNAVADTMALVTSGGDNFALEQSFVEFLRRRKQKKMAWKRMALKWKMMHDWVMGHNRPSMMDKEEEEEDEAAEESTEDVPALLGLGEGDGFDQDDFNMSFPQGGPPKGMPGKVDMGMGNNGDDLLAMLGFTNNKAMLSEMVSKMLSKSAQKKSGGMKKQSFATDFFACINEVMWAGSDSAMEMSSENQLCDAMSQELKAEWAAIMTMFINEEGFALPSNKTFKMFYRNQTRSLKSKMSAKMAALPFTQADMEQLREDTVTALTNTINYIEASDAREKADDLLFYTSKRDMLRSLDADRTLAIGTDITKMIQNAMRMSGGKKSSGLFGSARGRVGPRPTNVETCRSRMSFLRNKIRENAQKANGDAPAGGKPKGPPPKEVIWRKSDDGLISKGEFCKLTKMWFWTPVATCDCENRYAPNDSFGSGWGGWGDWDKNNMAFNGTEYGGSSEETSMESGSSSQESNGNGRGNSFSSRK